MSQDVGRYWTPDSDVDEVLPVIGPYGFALLTYFRRHARGNTVPQECCTGRVIRKRTGIDRDTVLRLLETLIEAGLISADRHPGRPPVITILATKPAADSGRLGPNLPRKTTGEAETCRAKPQVAPQPAAQNDRLEPVEEANLPESAAPPAAQNGRSLHTKESDRNRVKGGRVARPRFNPPTLDEVLSYFAEFKAERHAEPFFDHFASNGWKVGGKTPMVDWRAAARQWKRRQADYDAERIAAKRNGHHAPPQAGYGISDELKASLIAAGRLEEG